MSTLANRVARLEEKLSQQDCNCSARPLVIVEGEPMPERSCSVHPDGGRLVIIMRRFGSAPAAAQPGVTCWPVPKPPLSEIHWPLPKTALDE